MKTSSSATSITDAGRAAGYIPEIRASSTVEEIDEWIVAIGGREMPPDEAAAFDREVQWASIPGEDHRGNAV